MSNTTSPEYSVRSLNPSSGDEVDAVTRMCLTTVLETIPEFEGSEDRARTVLPNFTYEQMRRMIEGDLHKESYRFIVAVDGLNRVVGHSMVSRKLTDASVKYGYFFSRYVERAHRRRGLATRMLADALEWFDDDEWKFLLAHTHASNVGLRALFERHGFLVVEWSQTPWPALTLRLDR
jgi:ribosomal protein S18 acetylase RimI-like enzyme